MARDPPATPVALFHGDEDLTVRTAWGELSRDALRGLGFDCGWTVYEGMGHSACPDEFADVTAFLAGAVSGGGGKAPV